jgi:hypothetical protein
LWDKVLYMMGNHLLLLRLRKGIRFLGIRKTLSLKSDLSRKKCPPKIFYLITLLPGVSLWDKVLYMMGNHLLLLRLRKGKRFWGIRKTLSFKSDLSRKKNVPYHKSTLLTYFCQKISAP